MAAFFLSLAVIFVAELGDKSQLMALAFATRYRPLPVLVGISIATALVHLVSVLVGAVLGAAMPTHVINIVAAVSFVGFGLWTLRGDELSDDDEARAAKPAAKPLRLFDAGGLYLEVQPSGRKWWRWKYRFAGKEKRLSLGVYPETTLKQARTKRDEQRSLLAGGADPGSLLPDDAFGLLVQQAAPAELLKKCRRVRTFGHPSKLE